MLSELALPQIEIVSPPASGRPQSGGSVPSLEARLAVAPVRRVAAREHLWCSGDPRSHVYRVETGAIAIYAVMPDGRRHVVEFALPGDLIGLGMTAAHSFNAQALQDTRLRSVGIATFNQIVREDPRLGLKLYEELSRELAAARAQLMMVSKRVSGERVASFLLALSKRNADRGEAADVLKLPMRRLDIADFLGLTIETVSRTFTRLKKDGLVELGPGALVTITNREGLEAMAEGAGECEL